MSTASIRSSTSGCAERTAQAMEYTSAPLLGPRIAIFTARSFPFDFERRPISSSSGRFRRKKVPRYIWRSCRRTNEWTRWPNERTGRRAVTDRGRRSQIHSFRRRYAPTGDLPRICKLAIRASTVSTIGALLQFDHVAEDAHVLSVQRLPVLLHRLLERRLENLGILLELHELLDQQVDFQTMDALAVLRHARSRHQGGDLFVVGERHDRLVEHQGQHEVVEARGHHGVGRRQLADELFGRTNR